MAKTIKNDTRSIILDLKYSKNEVRLSKSKEFTSVFISKGFATGEAGQPALPWQRHFVSIPPQSKPIKVEVVKHTTILIAERIVVEPFQENEPTILGNTTKWIGPDKELYKKDVLWPEVFVMLSSPRRMSGFLFAEILICPFRYNPIQQKLELINKLTLKLTYEIEKDKKKKTDSTALKNRQMRLAGRIAKMVVNPKDIKPFYDLDLDNILPLPWLLPKVDYVIITDNLLSAPFQRLAQWRTWMGVRTRVVTVTDIISGNVPDTGGHSFWATSGFNDGGTRDEAEAIRNFIKWSAVNWGTDFVLLGGDTEVIPIRKGLHAMVGTVTYENLNNTDESRELGYAAVASSMMTGNPAYNVLDEDVSTMWQCDAADASPWIRLTIGAHTPVNKVVLEWGATHPASYTIDLSHDGINWTNAYNTNSGSGGTEQIIFNCASANYVRISPTGTTNFSLTGVKLYGPRRTKWDARAYSIDANTTRIFIGWAINMQVNATNSRDANLIIIKEGLEAGTIIPYNPAVSAVNPGWRFVEDLIESPVNTIPASTRFIEITGPAAIHGNPFVLKRDYNYIPTDLYYSDVEASAYPGGTTHDWDADDNFIYGERYGGGLDGVNGLADLFLGRAPVETVDEVNNFIEKIIRYERFQDAYSFLLPADFAVSVLLGSKNWAEGNTLGSLDGSAAGKENIRKTLLNYDNARWTFTRCYQDHADVPATDQGADLSAASKDEILKAIRQGNHIISLSSHGSPGYLCYLFSNDISTVINTPSLMYGNACSTNNFDLSGVSEAFSEHSILNTQGGAVAYAGNTRFGWTGDNPMEHEFWNQHLTSERLGEMFNACKQILLGWQSYSMNLLGDPVMRVWSNRPQQITVQHASEIETGRQTFNVTVKKDGAAVVNAAVTVVMEGSLFSTVRTNASGVASLSISPSLEGTMRVTVCGKNLIPYMGSITVHKEACGCRIAVMCPNQILCTPAISCIPMIGCSQGILCSSSITCRSLISCGQNIGCTSAIVCRSNINCGNIIACGANIVCSHSILCASSIVCPQINICPNITPRPDDFFRDFLENFWGVRDLQDLAEGVDPKEIEKMIERLPDEYKKPYREMFNKFIGKTKQ